MNVSTLRLDVFEDKKGLIRKWGLKKEFKCTSDELYPLIYPHGSDYQIVDRTDVLLLASDQFIDPKAKRRFIYRESILEVGEALYHRYKGQKTVRLAVSLPGENQYDDKKIWTIDETFLSDLTHEKAEERKQSKEIRVLFD